MEEKTKFQLRYLVIPDFAYKDKQLTRIDLLVYGFIHAYTNPFYFTSEQIGEMFGCHPETVNTSISHLKELNYIKTKYKTKAGGGKTRTCVDTCSEPVQRLVREQNFEATNQSVDLNKDKENILKEGMEEFEIPKTPSQRTASKQPKIRVFGNGGNSSAHTGNRSPESREEKGGIADGRNIR